MVNLLSSAAWWACLQAPEFVYQNNKPWEDTPGGYGTKAYWDGKATISAGACKRHNTEPLKFCVDLFLKRMYSTCTSARCMQINCVRIEKNKYLLINMNQNIRYCALWALLSTRKFIYNDSNLPHLWEKRIDPFPFINIKHAQPEFAPWRHCQGSTWGWKSKSEIVYYSTTILQILL